MAKEPTTVRGARAVLDTIARRHKAEMEAKRRKFAKDFPEVAKGKKRRAAKKKKDLHGLR